MLKQLKRTFMGPSRDPRMVSYISRPLPRDLPDEDVVAALDLALAENPDPRYLVETLPDALLKVTGRSFNVLDRSVRDVTDSYTKTMVMIRDGDIGPWPGYAARSYPLIRPPEKVAETAAAIIEAADEGGAASEPGRPSWYKSGWEPPPPPSARVRSSHLAMSDRGRVPAFEHGGRERDGRERDGAAEAS
jgi:hypothetical protein